MSGKMCALNLSFIFIHFVFRAVSSVDQLFVEKPSNRFFCPLTNSLLLEPHLTSCCGQHLSKEAINMIEKQKDGSACPLCTIDEWNTMLDKYFQRKVKGLLVFCHYKDEGCNWQGEWSALHYHTQSCQMKGIRQLHCLR